MMFMNRLLLCRTSSIIFFLHPSSIHPITEFASYQNKVKHLSNSFNVGQVRVPGSVKTQTSAISSDNSVNTLYILHYIMYLHVDAFMVCK